MGFEEAQVLQRHKKMNRAVGLSIPLHFGSVVSKRASELGKILLNGSDEFLRKHLMIEIVGVPESRSDAMMRQALEFSRMHSAHVSVEIAPTDRHLPLLKAGGVNMIQKELPEVRGAQDEKQVLREMRRFVEDANRQQFRTRLYGIDLLDRFKIAHESGASFLAGRAICGIDEKPNPPYQLPTSAIVGF